MYFSAIGASILAGKYGDSKEKNTQLNIAMITGQKCLCKTRSSNAWNETPTKGKSKAATRAQQAEARQKQRLQKSSSKNEECACWNHQTKRSIMLELRK